ncbi:MAG: GTP-binding protein [Alcanivoracaceae bacterium]|nr:GTP-binding protein [Alcanivoracaceae bacterium]
MKIAKKICLIGRFAVGKTSLVKQFINKQFGEKYKTTVGVSISTKEVTVNDTEVSLVIWDIAGFEQDGHYTHYLRGVHGVVWVLDGTEPESFNILDTIISSVPEIKQIPSICFINKHDLIDNWIINDQKIEDLIKFNYAIFKTSAKTGENVEVGFKKLAALLIN